MHKIIRNTVALLVICYIVFIGIIQPLLQSLASGSRPVHPTLTQEEFKKVELAYAETIRDIGARGRQLRIYSKADRAAFIQRYQGRPAAALVRAARDRQLPWYDIRTTSQEAIVLLAQREPNVFVKVRMIHDWVADVFAYDYDFLEWMLTQNGANAEFALEKIIERRRGVCLEYSVLFFFLLDAAGVENYVIFDLSNPDVGHAYNMVLIDGTGYIIDTTWDSGNRYENGAMREFKRMISKDYFMPDIARSYSLRGW